MCGYHNTTTKCASEGECTAESMCDGSAAACPKPVNKDDNTPCNQNTQVCKEGVSQCEKIGSNLERTFLSGCQNVQISCSKLKAMILYKFA